ncbi:hypothetical protein [Thalassobaculum sp.]|uniref:hypothetical protein n=1 Tax=Thalassobaculum sp. TaxID=2022740 RepID=UPI003B5CAFAF
MQKMLIALGLAMCIGALVTAPGAWACNVANNPTHPIGSKDFDRIAASTSQTLRQAFDNDACTILDGGHSSGSECVSGAGNFHTTVKAGNTTYHVFHYMVDDNDNVVNSNGLYCTTDRENGPIVR